MAKTIRTFSLTAVALCLPMLMIGSTARAQQPENPDNSAQNRNQNPGGTADNQPNASDDLHMTAAIRKAIIADKGLSTYAHNVKILVRSGNVTLKGVVKSENEKQQVASDAASVVSADRITNQLTVKS